MTKRKRKIYNKKWHFKNKKKRNLQIKKYQKIHNKDLKKTAKKYRILNKIKISKQKEEYYKRTKSKHKKYYIKNKKKILKRMKNYYIKNKEKILLRNRKYQKNHRKEINKYRKNKFQNDINFRLRHFLKNRLINAIKRNKKINSFILLLDCSIIQLKNHLQNQFKKGMSWQNYGKWHIDHIRPCASFDLSKTSQQRKCFNYKNLQPLWAKENQSKGKKIYKLEE